MMHESHNAPESTVTTASEVEGFTGRYARSFYHHILQYALVRCLFSFFILRSTSLCHISSFFLLLSIRSYAKPIVIPWITVIAQDVEK